MKNVRIQPEVAGCEVGKDGICDLGIAAEEGVDEPFAAGVAEEYFAGIEVAVAVVVVGLAVAAVAVAVGVIRTDRS